MGDGDYWFQHVHVDWWSEDGVSRPALRTLRLLEAESLVYTHDEPERQLA